MRRIFFIATVSAALLFLIGLILTLHLGGGFLIALTVTAGTTLYHLLVRLLIGFLVDRLAPENLDPRGFWFREHAWEKRVYRRLRVRKWARRVPTYRPEQFDIEKHTLSELVRQTCISELVHELIIPAGYLSLLFCFLFENPASELAPFLITATLAGLYELQFIVLQRFNRPTILRVLERRKKKSGNSAFSKESPENS